MLTDKEGRCMTIKGANQPEALTLVNMYAPTTGTRKHVKETLIDKARD